MNFNPFFDACWLFSGNPHKTKKSKLQDRAEDTSFEDVKESAEEQPKIDKATRDKQVAEAAESFSKELFEKSPGSGLLLRMTFLMGAQWADEHPRSNYNNVTEWLADANDEIDRMLSGACPDGDKDMFVDMVIFSSFLKGASWANDNPAPVTTINPGNHE